MVTTLSILSDTLSFELLTFLMHFEIIDEMYSYLSLVIILSVIAAVALILGIVFAVQTASNKLTVELTKEQAQQIVDETLASLPNQVPFSPYRDKRNKPRYPRFCVRKSYRATSYRKPFQRL